MDTLANQNGLSSADASNLLKKFGSNEVSEQKKNTFKKILKRLVSPISLMFIAALLLTGFAKETFDFYLIFSLALVNFLIGFWQEHKADNVVENLRKQLTAQTKVYRDSKWGLVDSRFLVPGDVVEIDVGDLVPADMTILTATNASLNEAALTGESLPKEKHDGEVAHSGAFLTTGLIRGKVTATGRRTEFGKTLFLIDDSFRRSLLEKDILSISKSIAVLSIVVMLIFSAVFLFRHAPLNELLLVDLSLLIAGIPVSLPTVMTIIIALGVAELGKKGAIVRRLASLEDLANVNLLLTDKTGTLSLNRLSIQKILFYGSYSENEVLSLASYAVSEGKNDMGKVIIDKVKALSLSTEGEVESFIPGDSERKRSTAFVKLLGHTKTVSLGAPQVIQGLCTLSPETESAFKKDLETLSSEGYRALALAIKQDSKEETGMTLVGLIAIADELRPESKGIIDFLKANGVNIKMVTGDSFLISKKVANELGLVGEVASGQELKSVDWKNENREWFDSHTAFSEVLPIDKYNLVQFARKFSVVAVTGDGVNDLPALKVSDVGIAVSNAVDALKSTADIVLVSPGIEVIQNALVEARKIFSRLYVYSVYRISESFRLIITIGVLGIMYGSYPLTAVQIILLALMNDIPIISLAFNRVKISTKPSVIHPKKRLLLGTLFGTVGILNSLILFFILVHFTSLSIASIQTIYFLKLTVSGHMLIYVAHTKERWYKYLPSKDVIIATTVTQLISSMMAGLGIFMAPISIPLIIFVWVWAFFWMQISELTKGLFDKHKFAVDQKKIGV